MEWRLLNDIYLLFDGNNVVAISNEPVENVPRKNGIWDVDFRTLWLDCIPGRYVKVENKHASYVRTRNELIPIVQDNGYIWVTEKGLFSRFGKLIKSDVYVDKNLHITILHYDNGEVDVFSPRKIIAGPFSIGPFGISVYGERTTIPREYLEDILEYLGELQKADRDQRQAKKRVYYFDQISVANNNKANQKL